MAPRTKSLRPKVDEPATEVATQIAPPSKSLRPILGYGPTKRTYNLNPVLLARYPANPWYGTYLTGLIDEILDHDADLQGMVTQRITPVTSGVWDIEEGAETEQGEICAAFVSAAFEALATADGDAGIRRDVGELLQAVFAGYAGSEVQWQRGPFRFLRPGSKRGFVEKPDAWTPFRILSRNRADIGFAQDTLEPLRIQLDHPSFGEPWPEMTLLLFRPYSRYEDAFGFGGKFTVVYWLAYFKRYLVEMALRDTEFTSTPTVVFELPETGMSDNDIEMLQTALENIHRQVGAILPPGVKPQLLAAIKGSVRESYEWLINMCNEGMARCLLGQSSTSIAGQQRGDIAQAEVHERVAQEIRLEDARAIEALMNNSLIKWLIDLNFPPSQRVYPRLCINVIHVKDLMQRSVVDQAVATIAATSGLALTKDYLEDTYGVELEENAMAMAALMPTAGGDTRPASDKTDNPKKPANNTTTRSKATANEANNQ